MITKAIWRYDSHGHSCAGRIARPSSKRANSSFAKCRSPTQRRYNSLSGAKGCPISSRLDERTQWNSTFSMMLGQSLTISMRKSQNHAIEVMSAEVSKIICLVLISRFSLVLSHCIDTSNMKHSLGSIFSEEDSNSSNDSENLTGSHRSMFSTAARLLERLKMSPSKSRLKKKRPWALKGLEKPMCRQLSPTKIRLNHQGGWDARGRAVIVVD